MTKAADAELLRAIDALAIADVLIEHRIISPGDEQALLPDELPAFSDSIVQVRRASGAARRAARDLLQRLGRSPRSIPKAKSGMPIWPDGIVGSLAHDSAVAIAVVAPREGYSSIGIDIEPAEPLDADLVNIVATEKERLTIYDEPLRGRLLFTVKEAVYKAAYPLDRMFLDHHDVEIDLASRTATISNGRVLNIRYGVSSHIVALAYVPAGVEPRPLGRGRTQGT